MADIVPRHVLCVLGNWKSLDLVDKVVRRAGNGFEVDREFSLLQPDDRMESSFEYSYDRVSPSMTDEDWQAVRNHSAVAYILSPPVRKKQGIDISRQALEVLAAVLREGGTAAKGESAGIAHGRDQWLEYADDAATAAKQGKSHDLGSALYWAWVRRPMVSEEAGVLYSCGMHLLGEPDVEIDSSLDLDTALEWIDLLGLYLVADRPARPIKDGAGFRLSDAGPRRIMRFVPCERYEKDGFMYNPYGYIRLEDTGP